MTALALALALGLEIEGNSACPTVAEITRRLENVAPPAGTAGDAPGAPAVVHVSSGAGRVRLDLLDGADGRVLAARELEATETCDDLAEAAAVVIATWQSDLDPQTSPVVELPAAPPPPRPPPVVAERVAPPSRPVSLGFGLLASMAGGEVAPGATLRASMDLGAPWLGVGGAVGVTTARAGDIGARANAASWTRGWLALGPEIHFGREPRLEAHAQALLGLLHVAGEGLPQATADTSPDLGVGAGASVARWIGNASVWLGFDVQTWPGRQRLLIDGLPDEGRVPRVDLQVAAGLGLGRAR